MLINNSMRFGTDEFILSNNALLTSKTRCWDLTNISTIENFEIQYNEPENTTIRVIFEADDGLLYKFEGNNAVEYTGSGGLVDIIQNGNTINELKNVSSTTTLTGKKVSPIIAMEALVDSTAMPSIKMGINVKAEQTIYTKTIDSAEIYLSSNNELLKISNIVADTTTTGNGSVEVTVSLLNDLFTWTDYMPVASAQNQQAIAVKFKIKYSVSVINSTDSAKLNSIIINSTSSQITVSGNFADLYTIQNLYDVELQTCSITIKHKQLLDSEIIPYVCFIDTPKQRKKINIGTGTGTTKSFTLGVNNVKDNNIDINSLKIYANDVQINSYDFDTSNSTVTFNATSRSIITASYTYDLGGEKWREMERQGDPQPYITSGIYAYMSRFTYILDDDEIENKTVSAVKIHVNKIPGKVINYSLGKATGNTQQFVLEHSAKQDTIVVNGSWSYEPESKILTVSGTKNTNLIISYDYEGESQTIYSFAAGWSASN